MDTNTYTLLFTELRRTLYHTCHHITRDHHLAEDLVQETYLRGFKYHHRLVSHSKTRCYLMRIAKNLCYNQLRKRSREHAEAEIRLGTLDQNYYRTDLNLEIVKHKERMTSNVYTGFVLHYYFGFTWYESSDQLGMNPHTLKSKLYRHRQSILHSGALSKCW